MQLKSNKLKNYTRDLYSNKKSNMKTNDRDKKPVDYRFIYT